MGLPLTGGLCVFKVNNCHEARKTMVALLTSGLRKKISVRSYPTKDRRTQHRAWSSCAELPSTTVVRWAQASPETPSESVISR